MKKFEEMDKEERAQFRELMDNKAFTDLLENIMKKASEKYELPKALIKSDEINDIINRILDKITYETNNEKITEEKAGNFNKLLDQLINILKDYEKEIM